MLMMFPFEAPTIFEGIHKSYFRMPRVVKDQKSKFENDDLFRQLSHESSVKYTGFKDRPLEERQMKFVANCQEGHTEVSVVQSGIQFTLMFNPTANPAYNNEGCDFNKELGKVHIKAGLILNGVCVLWRGWIDLQRLEGFGCLEFDEYRAYLEDAMLKQQLDKQLACNNSNNNNSSRNNHQTSPLHPHAHLDAAAAAVAAAVANQRLSSSAAAAGLNPATCLGAGATSLGNLVHQGTNNSLGHQQQQQQQQQHHSHHHHQAPHSQHQPSPQSQSQPHTHASNQHQQQHLLSPQAAPQAPPQVAPVTLADTSSYYGNAAIAAAAAAAFHQAFGVGGGGGIGIAPPSSQHQHQQHQVVRNLQRFGSSGGSLVAAAAGSGATLQTAPKLELQ